MFISGEGLWILLVVPYGLSWDHIAGPFTQASLHFVDREYYNVSMYFLLTLILILRRVIT